MAIDCASKSRFWAKKPGFFKPEKFLGVIAEKN
jgi:starvation-inducible outer membrane lipoprotein